MSEFIGRQISFALAVESVRGTAEATASRSIRKVTADVIPRAERKVDDSTTGRLEDSERIRTVRRWTEGNIAGVVHADMIGYLLTNLYGDVTSSTVSGATTHDFVLDQTIVHPTLTGFVKDGDVRQEKVPGTVVSNLELTAATDDYLRYSADFIGRESVADTSVLPALGTDYDFISRDITVKVASSEVGLSAATALGVKDLSISINPNAAANFVFGSYGPDDVHNRQFSLEVSFTRDYVDTTFQDLYEGDGSVYLQIAIVGEATIGSGSAHPALTFLLNKAQMQDWSRSSGADELVTEEITMRGLYNATDGEQSSVRLVNLTPEYVSGS
jgi:hypothetical protein